MSYKDLSPEDLELACFLGYAARLEREAANRVATLGNAEIDEPKGYKDPMSPAVQDFVERTDIALTSGRRVRSDDGWIRII